MLSRILRMLPIFIALTMSSGCEQQAASTSDPLLLVSKKMIDRSEALQADWNKRGEGPNHKIKGWGTNVSHSMQQAIDQLPEKKVNLVREELDPYSGGMGSFHRALLNAYIMTLCKRKDHSAMVTFFSHTCPEYVGSGSIEEFLASAWPDEAVNIMKGAYDNAGSPGRRAFWVTMFACAFPSLRKDHSNDDEFVESCAKWYEANKDHLKVNQNYDHEKPLNAANNPSVMELFVENQK